MGHGSALIFSGRMILFDSTVSFGAQDVRSATQALPGLFAAHIHVVPTAKHLKTTKIRLVKRLGTVDERGNITWRCADLV